MSVARFSKLNRTGDTIVEVMIVLAVLGLAIGLAYATGNRSLLNARQAQESSYASSLAQSQVEQLRGASDSPASQIYGVSAAPARFCFDKTSDAFTSFTNSNLLDTSGANYPAGCNFNIYYYISVTYDSANGQAFTVKVVWDDVLGQGKDTATLIYRVHPTQ